MSSTTQDYIDVPIRTAAILTNSFVIGDGPGSENIIGTVTDSKTNKAHLKNQLMLYLDFTLGSLTSAEIRIEFSPDNVTYYREVDDGAISSGVVPETVFDRQLTADGLYRLALPIKDRFVRISAQGTGTVTGSSLAVAGVLGIA